MHTTWLQDSQHKHFILLCSPFTLQELTATPRKMTVENTRIFKKSILEIEIAMSNAILLWFRIVPTRCGQDSSNRRDNKLASKCCRKLAKCQTRTIHDQPRDWTLRTIL